MKVCWHVIKVPVMPLGACLLVLALAELGTVPLSPPTALLLARGTGCPQFPSLPLHCTSYFLSSCELFVPPRVSSSHYITQKEIQKEQGGNC